MIKKKVLVGATMVTPRRLEQKVEAMAAEDVSH